MFAFERVSGHKRVIYFTKLAKLELIEIKLSQLIMAFQFP